MSAPRSPRVVARAEQPRSLSSRSVVHLLAKHLEIDAARVVPTARLSEELGASPLSLVQIALALEEHFDIEISELDVASFVTVEDVMACVVRARRLHPPHSPPSGHE